MIAQLQINDSELNKLHRLTERYNRLAYFLCECARNFELLLAQNLLIIIFLLSDPDVIMAAMATKFRAYVAYVGQFCYQNPHFRLFGDFGR